MELIDIVPEFNLYEEHWKIFTKSEVIPPQYFSSESVIEKSIVGEGSQIYGKVYNSVIGCGVVVSQGCEIRDSIVMNHVHIGKNCRIYKSIIAEDTIIGEEVTMGVGGEVTNEEFPHIYNHGLVCVGEQSILPQGLTVGKNTCVFGKSKAEDYKYLRLESGKNLIKAGDQW